MLTTETFDGAPAHGYIEYARTLERRLIVLKEEDRDSVLEKKGKIEEILSGHVPDVCPHGSSRKCGACRLEEVCYTT
jgi:CRISPR/Cas system-associated exonuclease Cas4 (RecB family)